MLTGRDAARCRFLDGLVLGILCPPRHGRLMLLFYETLIFEGFVGISDSNDI